MGSQRVGHDWVTTLHFRGWVVVEGKKYWFWGGISSHPTMLELPKWPWANIPTCQDSHPLLSRSPSPYLLLIHSRLPLQELPVGKRCFLAPSYVSFSRDSPRPVTGWWGHTKSWLPSLSMGPLWGSIHLQIPRRIGWNHVPPAPAVQLLLLPSPAFLTRFYKLRFPKHILIKLLHTCLHLCLFSKESKLRYETKKLNKNVNMEQEEDVEGVTSSLLQS